jgi:hypothetical protein
MPAPAIAQVDPKNYEAGPDGRTWWERLRVEHAVGEVARRVRWWRRMQGLSRSQRRAAWAAERRLCKGSSEYDVEAFLYWLHNYGWVRAEKDSSAEDDDLPTMRDMPFMPWEAQERAAGWFLERLRKKQTALCPKSREVGITWLVLHLLWWGWYFWGWSILIGSRKEELVDSRGDFKSLFERLRYITQRQPAWLVRQARVHRQFKLIEFLDNPAAVIAGESTAGGHFGRGDRRRVAFIDEYAAIPARIADALLRSTDSVAASLWIVYNPVGQSHPSYSKLYTQLPPECILELRWTADPYRPDDFFESKIVPYGKLQRADAEREWNCSHEEITEGTVFEWVPAVPYYDDASDWTERRDAAYRAWFNLGAWDFGIGKSYAVCAFALLEIDEFRRLRVWFDDVRVWKRTPAPACGEEALQVGQRYKGASFHVGDPAGMQTDSGGMGWEAWLKAAGVPIDVLPAAFNTSEAKEAAIDTAQFMMANGLIRISAERCQPLIRALQRWRRNGLKEGEQLWEVNGRTPPRKDEPSHACEAFLYAIMGAMKFIQMLAQQEQGTAAPSFVGKGSEEDVTDKLRRFYANQPYGGLALAA